MTKTSYEIIKVKHGPKTAQISESDFGKPQKLGNFRERYQPQKFLAVICE